jgi:hypothetical protein
VPRLYKGGSLKERESQENGHTRGTTEYNRMRIDLSVGNSHGKLVIEEETEVGL